MNTNNIISLPPPEEVRGLTAEAVQTRVQSGQVNVLPEHMTHSIPRIFRDNCFTLFNFVNVTLATLVITFGTLRNALFLGVALFSTAMSIIQEIRAKRTIEKLSLFQKGTVEAVRDDQICSLEQCEIVLDDVLLLHLGDQIPVDGECLFSLGVSLNESNITGEMNEVEKQPGDKIFSGSFVTAGSCYMKVTAVGKHSFAAKLSLEAKTGRRKKSRLMQALNLIVKVLAISIIPVGLLLFGSKMLGGATLESAILGATAALVGMIPQGLILLTNIAFAVGVINLGKKDTVVQSLSSIESLARVDTLCLDKTGTITTGQLTLERLIPRLDFSEAEIRAKLAKLMAVNGDRNATALALKAEFLGTDSNGTKGSTAQAGGDTLAEPLELIPFSSLKKYSGAVFADEELLIGATSFLFPEDQELCREAQVLGQSGNRVLVFSVGKRNGDGGILERQASAFVLFKDVVRVAAAQTVQYFTQQRVTLKVITGDDPVTTSQIAQSVGISGAEHYINVGEIKVSGEPEASAYESIVGRNVVFGRVSPFQKRSLIRAMQHKGHVVAMVGDGVNDVLALKEADCSIAMAQGSEASRSVADLVLLKSDFSSMIAAVNEGRRVINNIERVAAMYLVKTMFSALLAVIFIFLKSPYPFTPIQLSLVSVLTIGIPSFLITLKPNRSRVQNNFLDKIIVNSVPTALMVVLGVLTVYLMGSLLNLSQTDIGTICTFVTGGLGLLLVVRLSYPFTLFRRLMVIGLTVAFGTAFLLAGNWFGFSPLMSYLGLLAVGLTGVMGAGVIFLQRFLRRLVILRRRRRTKA